MELIKSSSSIIPYDPDPLKHIELVARNCYKSEDKIADGTALKLVKMLHEKGHHAMLEFYPFYFLCDTNYADKLLKINNYSDVNGDLMIYNKISEPFTQVSCNLRTVMMISNYNGWLAGAISNEYKELSFLFKEIKFNYSQNSNPCVLVDKDRVETFLQYLTAKFIIDRGVSHELVRHRKCSFAQESTRYCNYGKDHIKFIIPSWINIKEGILEDISNEDTATKHYLSALLDSENRYGILNINFKWSPQQARSVLPNSLKTEIIVQARFSEWKHIFKQRCAKSAHPDMQALMIPFFEEVCKSSNEYYVYLNM